MDELIILLSSPLTWISVIVGLAVSIILTIVLPKTAYKYNNTKSRG